MPRRFNRICRPAKKSTADAASGSARQFRPVTQVQEPITDQTYTGVIVPGIGNPVFVALTKVNLCVYQGLNGTAIICESDRKALRVGRGKTASCVWFTGRRML